MRIALLTTDGRSMSDRWGTNRPSFGTAPEALIDGFAATGGAEVHVISCLRRPMDCPDFLKGAIRFHSLVVPKTGWMTTLYHGCVRSTRRFLADLRPDLVHGQGTERDCAMSAVHSGFPNVLTIHGNMQELQRLGFHRNRWFGAAAAMLETHCLRRTEGVFCNSAYTRGLVAPRTRRTWLVPNAIRTVFFRPPADTRPRNDVPLLLNVGLVSPRKQQLEVLRMVGGIVREGHAVRVLFAGGWSESSEYGRQFRSELRSAETDGHAAHVGYLDAEQLVDLMDQADGLLHFPSEEAFGLVVAEALARGLKFFGSNLGGIVDIASGIEAAELHDSFESLANGLRRWLRNGAHRPANAAAQITQRYHPEVVARRHHEVYGEVLRGTLG